MTKPFGHKKQAKPKPWFQQILSYQVYQISIQGWLGLILLCLFVAGVIYLFFNRYAAPTMETKIVEVTHRSSRMVTVGERAHMVYRVEFKEDETISGCRMSPVYVKLWHQLEIGKRYEFDINVARDRCFIVGVRDIQ